MADEVRTVPPASGRTYATDRPPLTVENLWLLSGTIVSRFSMLWVAGVLVVSTLLGAVTWIIVRDMGGQRGEDSS